jgi:hypothetical protein
MIYNSHIEKMVDTSKWKIVYTFSRYSANALLFLPNITDDDDQSQHRLDLQFALIHFLDSDPENYYIIMEYIKQHPDQPFIAFGNMNDCLRELEARINFCVRTPRKLKIECDDFDRFQEYCYNMLQNERKQ